MINYGFTGIVPGYSPPYWNSRQFPKAARLQPRPRHFENRRGVGPGDEVGSTRKLAPSTLRSLYGRCPCKVDVVRSNSMLSVQSCRCSFKLDVVRTKLTFVQNVNIIRTKLSTFFAQSWRCFCKVWSLFWQSWRCLHKVLSKEQR